MQAILHVCLSYMTSWSSYNRPLPKNVQPYFIYKWLNEIIPILFWLFVFIMTIIELFLGTKTLLSTIAPRNPHDVFRWIVCYDMYISLRPLPGLSWTFMRFYEVASWQRILRTCWWPSLMLWVDLSPTFTQCHELIESYKNWSDGYVDNFLLW